MAYDIYSSADLAKITRKAIPDDAWLTQMFFPQTRSFQTEYVAFDEIGSKKPLAPFVMPCVNGVPVVHQGYNTKVLKPAYIKLEDRLEPCDFTRRQFGEAINGAPSMSQRMNNARLNALDAHRAALLRTEQWMAAQVLQTGSYTLQGDNYPTTAVDFQRNAALNIVPAVLWSNAATATPVDDIETAAQLVYQHGKSVAMDVILSPDAWNALRNTAQFKAQYQINQPPGGALPNITPQAMGTVQDKGMLGSFHLWVYAQTYELNGIETPYIDNGTCLVVSREGLSGIKLYGAIQNVKAISEGRHVSPAYQHEWVKDDGSAHLIGTESAPLIAPGNPDAVANLSVL